MRPRRSGLSEIIERVAGVILVFCCGVSADAKLDAVVMTASHAVVMTASPFMSYV